MILMGVQSHARCDNYADQLMSRYPVDFYAQEYAYDILYHSYFLKCMVTLPEAAKKIAPVVSLANRVFTDIRAGKDPRGSEVKADLQNLVNALGPVKAWFTWWADTYNGGQDAIDALARLGEIEMKIKNGKL